MQDLYVEQIVKVNRQKKGNVGQTALIVVAALMAAVALLLDYRAIILCIAAAIGAWYMGSKQNQEYEYIFVNGQLDVDVVKTSRRKRLGTFQMEELICMVPLNSPRMEGYKGQIKKHIKAVTGSTNQPMYAMIFKSPQGYVQVDVELEAELMKALRLTVPHKILS